MQPPKVFLVQPQVIIKPRVIIRIALSMTLRVKLRVQPTSSLTVDSTVKPQVQPANSPTMCTHSSTVNISVRPHTHNY